MKRIGIISGSCLLNIWNGLGRQTTALAWGLAKDYQVTVFNPAESSTSYKKQRGQVLTYNIGLATQKHKASLSLVQIEEWNLAVSNQLEDLDFDILILPNCDGYLAAQIYKASHLNVKIIGFVPYIYKSANWIEIPELRSTVCAIEKAFLADCDVLIAHSTLLAEAVANEAQREVSVIPSTEMIVDRYKLREEKKGHVCYVGRMNKSKSIETILRAVVHLPEVTLTLTSPENSDRYAERLRKMATELGISDRVTVKGWMNSQDVKTLYRDSEVAVVSGIYEPYGHSVIDPMSLGTRVIVSEFSGLTDYLYNLENRYTNTQSLVDIIKKKLVMSFKESIAERIAGQEHVQKNFDVNVIIKQLEHLL